MPRWSDSHNVIGVDRLCRVIHSVNFLTQQPQQQALYLNVNGRHLLGIASGRHGATFEALLAYCGLAPQQVVLEIIESSVDDLALLQQAITAYKAKGFRIAIDDFGPAIPTSTGCGRWSRTSSSSIAA